MRPSSSLRVVCRFEAGTEASQLPPQCVDSHCLTLRSSRRILVCLAGSPSRSAAMSADIEPSASYVPVARQRSKIARPNDLLALLRRKRLSPVVRTAPVCRRPWQPICRRPPVDRVSYAARPSWYARRARARQPTPAIGAPHTTLIRARTHPSHRRVFRGDGGRSVAASIASTRYCGLFRRRTTAPAAATTTTIQQTTIKGAMMLALREMSAPATVGQPATAQPCSHACHAHAPHARDGAQRRFAHGRREMSWRQFLRGGVRSAWLQCVSDLYWARQPTDLGCGIAREERERSTARPLPWCVLRTNVRGRS